jgi:hypothetical protein
MQASIERIGLSADPLSNTFQIELKALNPGEALKHGMIARARIDYLVYPEAISIPLSSVTMSEIGPRALVVEKRDGRDIACMREIQPVSVQDNLLLVRKGIAAGDRLIVSGAKGIIHGQAVKVLIENGRDATGKLLQTAGTGSDAGGRAPSAEAAPQVSEDAGRDR